MKIINKDELTVATVHRPISGPVERPAPRLLFLRLGVGWGGGGAEERAGGDVKGVGRSWYWRIDPPAALGASEARHADSCNFYGERGWLVLLTRATQ